MRVFSTTVAGSMTVCVNIRNLDSSIYRMAHLFKSVQECSESEFRIHSYLCGQLSCEMLHLTPAEYRALRQLKTWFSLNALGAKNASPVYVCVNLNTGKSTSCLFQKVTEGGSSERRNTSLDS